MKHVDNFSGPSCGHESLVADDHDVILAEGQPAWHPYEPILVETNEDDNSDKFDKLIGTLFALMGETPPPTDSAAYKAAREDISMRVRESTDMFRRPGINQMAEGAN